MGQEHRGNPINEKFINRKLKKKQEYLTERQTAIYRMVHDEGIKDLEEVAEKLNIPKALLALEIKRICKGLKISTLYKK